MGALIKNKTSVFIPADPGQPGSPYIPAQPARTVWENVTTCVPGAQFRVVDVYPHETLFGKLGILGDGGLAITLLSAASVDSNGDGITDFTRYVVELTGGAAVCTTQVVPVYYPATAAVPAVPYAPPTPAQISASLNEGWNSYARSIDQLEVSAYYEATIKAGTYAAALLIGPVSMEGQLLSAFSHGILVDSSGVFVFENGTLGVQLASTYSGAVLRIVRLKDSRIAYQVGSAIYVSDVQLDELDEVYVYGLLYAGGDEVMTSAFVDGDIISVEGRATLRGSGELTARPLPRAVLTGEGALNASFATAVILSGEGNLFGEFVLVVASGEGVLTGSGELTGEGESFGRGSIVLLPLTVSGGDYDYPANGYTELPLFTFSASEAEFVPMAPTVGYVNLPFLSVWGEGSEVDIGNGSISLPMFLVMASESEYGIGSASLPYLLTSGSGGFIAEDEMQLFSTMLATSKHVPTIDLVMVLTSEGIIASSFELERNKVLELMSSLENSSVFSLSGVYGLTLLSGANVASLEGYSVDDRPDLFENGAVWVLNLDTNATTRYEEYGFNSFFERDGKYYGVANDGIYFLEGNRDVEEPINALVELVNADLGSKKSKRVGEAYIHAASEGALVLKVTVEGETYYYAARSSSEYLASHRAAPGKGLNGVYWRFGVVNQDGDDFTLAGVQYSPAVNDRKI